MRSPRATWSGATSARAWSSGATSSGVPPVAAAMKGMPAWRHSMTAIDALSRNDGMTASRPGCRRYATASSAPEPVIVRTSIGQSRERLRTSSGPSANADTPPRNVMRAAGGRPRRTSRSIASMNRGSPLRCSSRPKKTTSSSRAPSRAARSDRAAGVVSGAGNAPGQTNDRPGRAQPASRTHSRRCALSQTNVSASSMQRRSMNTHPISRSVARSRRSPSASHNVGDEPWTTKCVSPNARPSDLASSEA